MDFAQAIKDMERGQLERFALSTFNMNADLQAIAAEYEDTSLSPDDDIWTVGNKVIAYFDERGLL